MLAAERYNDEAYDHAARLVVRFSRVRKISMQAVAKAMVFKRKHDTLQMIRLTPIYGVCDDASAFASSRIPHISAVTQLGRVMARLPLTRDAFGSKITMLGLRVCKAQTMISTQDEVACILGFCRNLEMLTIGKMQPEREGADLHDPQGSHTLDGESKLLLHRVTRAVTETPLLKLKTAFDAISWCRECRARFSAPDVLAFVKAHQNALEHLHCETDGDREFGPDMMIELLELILTMPKLKFLMLKTDMIHDITEPTEEESSEGCKIQIDLEANAHSQRLITLKDKIKLVCRYLMDVRDGRDHQQSLQAYRDAVLIARQRPWDHSMPTSDLISCGLTG